MGVYILMPNKRKLLHNKHKVTVPKDTSHEKKPPFHDPCTTTRAAKERQNALYAPRATFLTHIHLLQWCLLVWVTINNNLHLDENSYSANDLINTKWTYLKPKPDVKLMRKPYIPISLQPRLIPTSLQPRPITYLSPSITTHNAPPASQGPGKLHLKANMPTTGAP